MSLITINLGLVSPYGENDKVHLASGRAEFTPLAHGKFNGAFRTVEKVTAAITDGQMRPVELTPGPWKVAVFPVKSAPWPEMHFVLEEGMPEPVNIVDFSPDVVVGTKQIAKGPPGPPGPLGPPGPPGPEGKQGSTVPNIRTLRSGEDIFNLGVGMYVAASSAVALSLVNAPEALTGVYVMEGPAEGSPIKSIRFIPHGREYEWETRSRNLVGAMRTWQKHEHFSNPARRGVISPNTDIDMMRGEGWLGSWDTPGAGSDLNSLKGTWPEIDGERIPRLAVVGVNGTLSQINNMGYQTMALLASGSLTDTQFLIRFNQGYNRSGPEAWTEWVRLDTPDLTDRVEALEAYGGASLPVNALATGNRAIREQLFLDEYPLVSTQNRGAVVFRYDHGLTNFKNVLWPLHEQYGIKAYIAMNSRNWGLSENSGATQAEARSWSSLVEWGNHTADHEDKTGIADIWDSIVNGRIELEDQLRTTVHGFTMPGVTEFDRFDGLGVGYASGYSDTYAGSLILNHHAIASGVIGSQFRTLDGVIRQGGRHHGWENKTWEEIKSLIDEAVETRTALTLMQHPRTMGIDGYWTPELAEQVISYVRQLIDAGDLADISYYQSHHAQLSPLPAPPIDTGWRNMSSQFVYGWTGGEIYIRRIGDEVAIVFKGLDGTNATNAAAIALPTGFEPDTFTGGSQAFYVRAQTGDDIWGSAGNGFMRLAIGFVSRTGTWTSIRYPAQTALPDMGNLPGVSR